MRQGNSSSGRSVGDLSKNLKAKTKWAMASAFLPVLLLASAMPQGGNVARDPGPRSGVSGAGGLVNGLPTDDVAYFTDGQDRFQVVESVAGGSSNGLGPTFNSNSCSSCHSQPEVGGSSPALNPQVAVATSEGATNKIPSFITPNGPVREARFKFALNSNGSLSNTPDGGVHGLFTIQGRTDAPGCKLSQPDFDQAIAQNNVSYRIPTPIFGAGLMESISDDQIMANESAHSLEKRQLGITGHANRSGNDGSITRFGWKAQNKSLLIFAGEAYNVEMGITNELFPNERGYPPTPLPANCLGFTVTPEDATNFDATSSSQVPSDVVAFANFMRFLDQPQPACQGANCSTSIQDGRHLFADVVKCSACHTPAMVTDKAYVPALTGINANLFSDLLVHHMGSGLADGVTQGSAGPDEFRTAPLWGLGQRLFFLHDGRTSDLLQAIEEHAGQGSEANQVIRNFNQLSEQQQQDILNFLRSL